ncbi:MAG: hypothetical protein C0483_09710 [Pirellula sp.]|nr:hypothetical protein [Pirellula sp.]
MMNRLHTLGNDVRRRFEQLRRARPAIVPMVAAASALLFLVYIFIALADEITEGETQRIDEQILLWFRQVNDHALPIGPTWLTDGMLDATALGSPLVVGIIVATAAGFLFMEGQRRVALLMVLTTIGGGTASLCLKWLFARPRPEIVPHLRHVTSSSFPSGHAMLSAVVYLTIGVMFMKAVRSRRAKAYCLTVAVLLTLLVGATRVFLGVHYPSDVLGGWIAGVSWASLCWIIGVFIPTRPIPERSDVPTAPAA